MTGIITPSTMPNINSPIGTDGTDFHAFQQDKAADGLPNLRTSFPIDRAMTNVANLVNVNVPAHGNTVRYTYTVPSAKRSILQHVRIYMDDPAAGFVVGCQIQVVGFSFISVTFPNGFDVLKRNITMACQILLMAGDTVLVYTNSTDAANRTFQIATFIAEFAA